MNAGRHNHVAAVRFDINSRTMLPVAALNVTARMAKEPVRSPAASELHCGLRQRPMLLLQCVQSLFPVNAWLLIGVYDDKARRRAGPYRYIGIRPEGPPRADSF